MATPYGELENRFKVHFKLKKLINGFKCYEEVSELELAPHSIKFKDCLYPGRKYVIKKNQS